MLNLVFKANCAGTSQKYIPYFIFYSSPGSSSSLSYIGSTYSYVVYNKDRLVRMLQTFTTRVKRFFFYRVLPIIFPLMLSLPPKNKSCSPLASFLLVAPRPVSQKILNDYRIRWYYVHFFLKIFIIKKIISCQIISALYIDFSPVIPIRTQYLVTRFCELLITQFFFSLRFASRHINVTL